LEASLAPSPVWDADRNVYHCTAPEMEPNPHWTFLHPGCHCKPTKTHPKPMEADGYFTPAVLDATLQVHQNSLTPLWPMETDGHSAPTATHAVTT
jgi:hypothetical protein